MWLANKIEKKKDNKKRKKKGKKRKKKLTPNKCGRQIR